MPQEETIPDSQTAFFGNITVPGAPAPARGYIEELLPDTFEGGIEPGRVFDREAIKVMIAPWWRSGKSATDE